MASHQLSPKKYIETRARTLPVYKCLVNKDWRAASEANVIVMRRHVNGNITAGIFLIDLLCLGVKDTFYFFNEPERELYERFPTDVEEMFEEVAYALAHNIIYAGHDFALDFDIGPDKEFAVTKFILEEDNDAIPLIEIPVGNREGKPQLIVNQPGEYSSALAKLQKNAGEGNYEYSITGLSEDEDAENDSDDLDDNTDTNRRIEDHEFGRITPYEAQFISTEELNDFDKVEERSGIEKITMLAEEALRKLRKMQPEFFDADLDEELYDTIDESETMAYGITALEEDNFFNNFEEDLIDADADMPDEKSEAYLQDLLDNHADKLLVMSAVFEIEYGNNGNLLSLARSRMEDLQVYPLARLELALANLLEPAPAAGFETIYQQPDLKKLFPEVDSPGTKDLSVLQLIQTVLHLRSNNLEAAIRSYQVFSFIDIIHFMASLVQIELIEAINKAMIKN